MPSITSTGVGSGLDVNSIVTQLMAIERRPLSLLQQAKTDLNTQVSSFGQLQSLTSAMRDAAQALTSVSTWNQTVASSADTSAVTVTTTTGAAAGKYAVSVDHLAAAQTISSQPLPNSTSTLNEGTLTIELGSWTDEPTPSGFIPKQGASPVTVTIGPGDTSLEGIRDKINASAAGVTASIIKDASGARLALRSRETGAENAFRITAVETVDDGSVASGLSSLGFDATVSSPMTRNQSAVNAKAKINGIDVESASNQLDGTIDGLTLQLLKPTAGEVAINVSADTDSVKAKINSFVSSFNSLASFIREQTKYNPDSKTAGSLQGDRVVGTVLQQLRGVLNTASTGSSTFARLSDIGIAMKADGTLETNSTKLDSALSNLPELRKLLAADTGSGAALGFMTRYRNLGDQLLETDGAFNSRSKSLQSMIERNDKSQASLQLRLDNTETRMRAQYQALDVSMAKLNGLSSYISGQIAQLNKTA